MALNRAFKSGVHGPRLPVVDVSACASVSKASWRCRRRVTGLQLQGDPVVATSCSWGAAVALPAQLSSRHRAVSCASQPPANHSSSLPPPLQVTRHNFAAALLAIKQALQECQFYSFDCEMTGLWLQGQEDFAVDDVDDRYIKTAAAAEQFLVTQFGLSLFTWMGNHYEARSFNFYLFPAPTDQYDLRFMSQASSLAFLASQGFDFNKMIYEGIPFSPLCLQNKQQQQQRASATPPNLQDLDEDELLLVSHLHDKIYNWLSQPDGPDTLYLPAPPPQLLKLQQRLLAAGIGSSRWRSSNTGSSDGNSSNSKQQPDGWYLVEHAASPAGAVDGGSSSRSGSSSNGTLLRRATAVQAVVEQQRNVQHAAEQASLSAGFSHLFELLRDSHKPAVGHNVRFDLVFSIASFVQAALPDTWSEFKTLVQQWFPGGIYDTKYMARCLFGSNGAILLQDTGLDSLFRLMTPGGVVSPQPLGSNGSSSSTMSNLSAWMQQRSIHLDEPQQWRLLPAVAHAEGCESYAAASTASSSNSSFSHEAGYDAFMTGVVFVGLMRLHEIDGLTQLSRWQLPLGPSEPPSMDAVQQYAWRQHNSKSRDIPYAALQGPEVVPRRPEVLYLTGFRPGTRWQDIQRKFAQLGLGRPSVSFVRGNGLSAAATGAYVIMPNGRKATKALQVVRQDKWTVEAMSYSDYFYSKHGRGVEVPAASSSSINSTVDSIVGSNSSSSSVNGTINSTAVQHLQAVRKQLQRHTAELAQQQDSQTEAAAESSCELDDESRNNSSSSNCVDEPGGVDLQQKASHANAATAASDEPHTQQQQRQQQPPPYVLSVPATSAAMNGVADAAGDSNGQASSSSSSGDTQHRSELDATSSNGKQLSREEMLRYAAIAESQRRLDLVQKQAATAGGGISTVLALKRPPPPRPLKQ